MVTFNSIIAQENVLTNKKHQISLILILMVVV